MKLLCWLDRYPPMRVVGGWLVLFLAACLLPTGGIANPWHLAHARVALPSETTNVPSECRGYWHIVGRDDVVLPPAHAEYELELVADPAACLLYKNKGVSRLKMRRGCQLTLEADLTVIQFGEKPDFELVLILDATQKQELSGTLRITQQGKTTLKAKIRLERRDRAA